MDPLHKFVGCYSIIHTYNEYTQSAKLKITLDNNNDLVFSTCSRKTNQEIKTITVINVNDKNKKYINHKGNKMDNIIKCYPNNHQKFTCKSELSNNYKGIQYNAQEITIKNNMLIRDIYVNYSYEFLRYRIFSEYHKHVWTKVSDKECNDLNS